MLNYGVLFIIVHHIHIRLLELLQVLMVDWFNLHLPDRPSGYTNEVAEPEWGDGLECDV